MAQDMAKFVRSFDIQEPTVEHVADVKRHIDDSGQWSTSWKWDGDPATVTATMERVIRRKKIAYRLYLDYGDVKNGKRKRGKLKDYPTLGEALFHVEFHRVMSPRIMAKSIERMQAFFPRPPRHD